MNIRRDKYLVHTFTVERTVRLSKKEYDLERHCCDIENAEQYNIFFIYTFFVFIYLSILLGEEYHLINTEEISFNAFPVSIR